MTGAVFDARICALGEGPLWHPERQQLFWFDILGKRLLSRQRERALEWAFDEHVSAAGWIDRDTLMIASETRLFAFDLETGAQTDIYALEADWPGNRSNDGRADPQGGFWIGTMGKAAEAGAGTIYRWYRGALEMVVPGVTISNAICFAPCGRIAYYADTAEKRIMRMALDAEGWPEGTAEVLVDMADEALNPDGCIVDAQGCLWNAQWGAHRVACYGPEGEFREAVAFEASQISCPSLTPDGMLYATSAAHGAPRGEAGAGQTYAVQVDAVGQQEHRVLWQP